MNMVKIMKNNGKTTHNSEVMEAYCTNYLPSLFLHAYRHVCEVLQIKENE